MTSEQIWRAAFFLLLLAVLIHVRRHWEEPRPTTSSTANDPSATSSPRETSKGEAELTSAKHRTVPTEGATNTSGRSDASSDQPERQTEARAHTSGGGDDGSCQPQRPAGTPADARYALVMHPQHPGQYLLVPLLTATTAVDVLQKERRTLVTPDNPNETITIPGPAASGQPIFVIVNRVEKQSGSGLQSGSQASAGGPFLSVPLAGPCSCASSPIVRCTCLHEEAASHYPPVPEPRMPSPYAPSKVMPTEQRPAGPDPGSLSSHLGPQ